MRHPDGRDTTYPLFLQESQGLKSDFRMREIIMQGTASLLLTLSIISLSDINFKILTVGLDASQTALYPLPFHLPKSDF